MKQIKNYNKYIRNNLRLKQDSKFSFFSRVTQWENEVNWRNWRTGKIDVKHS